MDRSDAFETQAPDEEFLRRFLDGEAGACRRVERWAREVAFYGRLRLSRDDRDEVVQETVTAVWQAASRDSFHLRVSFRAFVKKIATARCIDRLRRRRPSQPLSPEVEDSGPGPYDEVLRSDERAQVHWALRSVGQECREILRQFYLEGMTHAEIAATTGRAEATMRVRLFNCLKAIRGLIARWRPGEPREPEEG